MKMGTHKLPNTEVYKIIDTTTQDDADKLLTEVMASLSSFIKDYRKQNKITNRGLADKSGLTTSIMSRVESGYQNLTMATICKVLSQIGGQVTFSFKDETQKIGGESI